MGQHHENHIAMAGMVAAPGGRGAQYAFDHTDGRLHLPALAIPFLVEADLHHAAVATFGGRCRWAAVLGRNQGQNAVLVPAEFMIGIPGSVTVTVVPNPNDVCARRSPPPPQRRPFPARVGVSLLRRKVILRM